MMDRERKGANGRGEEERDGGMGSFGRDECKKRKEEGKERLGVGAGGVGDCSGREEGKGTEEGVGVERLGRSERARR